MPIDPLSLRPSGPLRPSAPPPRAAPASGDFRAHLPTAPARADRVELSAGIPASPPPEVLDAVGAAAEAFERLHATGRQLRFQEDPRSGVMVIEVRDLDGQVLKRIPPTEAMALASGDFR